MKTLATFIGENSLGYERGKTYDLWFITTDNFPKRIEICRLPGMNQGVCQYSSLKKFLQNWQVR